MFWFCVRKFAKFANKGSDLDAAKKDRICKTAFNFCLCLGEIQTNVESL